MGRRAKWSPRALTQVDEDVVVTFGRKYASLDNARTRRRVIQQFVEALTISGITSVPKGFRRWVGSLHRAGLRWSTVDTYSTYVLQYLNRLPLSFTEGAELRAVKKIVALAHADEDAKIAPVLDLNELRSILQRAKEFDEGLHYLLLFIVISGGRVADLRRLRNRQIRLTMNLLQVQWRITKNHRSRSGR